MINHDMFDHYNLVMGLEGRFQGWCPPDAPRVYVYDMGDLADRPISCARIGFWGSEVYVDRFLRHTGCRTQDAEAADLGPARHLNEKCTAPIFEVCLFRRVQ